MKPLVLETDEVKSDFYKVKEYIKSNPTDIQYASENLRNNKELVDLAVNLDYFSYEYVGDEIKEDKNFAFSVFKKNKTMFRHFSSTLKNDEDFIANLIDYDPFFLTSGLLDEKWKSNEKVMRNALKESRMVKENKCSKLFEDYDFVKTLIKRDSMSYFFFDKKVKGDLNLKRELFDVIDPYVRFLLLSDVDNQNLVNEFVNKDFNLYKELNPNLKSEDLSLAYLKNELEKKEHDDISMSVLKYLPESLLKDKGFWMKVSNLMGEYNQGFDETDESFKLLIKPKEVKSAYKDFKKDLSKIIKSKNKPN